MSKFFPKWYRDPVVECLIMIKAVKKIRECLYPFAVRYTLIRKIGGLIHKENFKPVFMRHSKKIMAIAAMSAIVIFIQCSKTFEKADEQGKIEEQSGNRKKEIVG